ncbi:MAG TPA: hypothetical protein PLX97_06850, partial [Gemmatales bacterium]|nr:hypothetical protein [Gemmatales bacterium]
MRPLVLLCSVVFCSSSLYGQVTTPTLYTGKDVWVVVNSNMVSSVALGEFYCQQRQVPAEQLIKLALPEGEEMSREDYENKLLKPLQEKLKPLQKTDF